MSNLVNLHLPGILDFITVAQTTLPTGAGEDGRAGQMILAAMVGMGALVSVTIIVKRRLWAGQALPMAELAVPPGDMGDNAVDGLGYQPMWQAGGSAGVGAMAGVLVSAIAAYLAAAALCFRILGLTGESIKTLDGQRLAILCQPVAQLAAIAVIVGMLKSNAATNTVIRWRKPDGRDVRGGLGTWLLAWPWVMLVGLMLEALIVHLDIKADKQHMIFELWKAEPRGVSLVKLVAFASATITAPVAEELFFRGLMQRILQRMFGMPMLVVVLSSLAFAWTHQPWTLRPPVFVLSLALGWAYYRSGSIWVPMIAHAAFNAAEFGLFVLGT